MKLKQWIGIVGAGLCCAQAAMGQSSVTVFGVVDVNMRAVKNGPTGWDRSIANDGVLSSRIGFRGVEDLGGGLSAGFWLEGAINPDVGASRAKFWSRRSTVQLAHAKYGELRLGHDYTPVFRAYANYDPMGVVGLGSITNILGTVGSNAGTLVTADNAVVYFLPSGLGGVYGDAMVAANEGVSTVNTPTSATISNNRLRGARIGYADGPLNVSSAYSETTINVGAPGKLKQIHVGGAYTLGTTKLIAQYVRGEYLGQRQGVLQLGAIVPIATNDLKFSLVHGDMSGGGAAGFRDADDATLFAVSYVHNLSRRTAIYGTAAFIENKGASARVLPGGAAAMPAGDKARGAEVGIKHTF